MIIYKEEGKEIFRETIFSKNYENALKFAKYARFYKNDLKDKEIEIKEVKNG